MRKYRKDFSEVLTSSNSNLTKSRFLRLFLLAMTLVAVVLPTQFYVLYRNSVVPLLPYSWAAIHGPEWNNIPLIQSGGTVLFDRWIQVAAGFALFPFFGLGKDAQKMYRQGLLKIGFGRMFPCLHRQSHNRRSQNTLTNSLQNSFGSRARLFFHKKESEGSMQSM